MSKFYGSVNAILRDSTANNLTELKQLIVNNNVHLMVISDFDHTLTKFSSPQCHEIVGYNKRYTKLFMKEFNRMLMTTSSSLEEQWKLAHKFIVEESGLTEEMFLERLNDHKFIIRDGLKDFVGFLRENLIPLIIVSAGIRNVIVHTLDYNDVSCQFDHLFHIDANYVEFHDHGGISDILPEKPVHSNAKKDVHKRAPHMFPMIKEYSTCNASIGQNVNFVNVHECFESVDDKVNRSESDCKEAAENSSIFNNICDNENNCNLFNDTTTTVAIILGDRPGDFDILGDNEIDSGSASVRTFKIGFAKTIDSPEADMLLSDAVQCDVVLIGEGHDLGPVYDLLQELVQLSKIRKF